MKNMTQRTVFEWPVTPHLLRSIKGENDNEIPLYSVFYNYYEMRLDLNRFIYSQCI